LNIFKNIIKALRWAISIFFVSSILMVVIYRFIPVYFTPLMFIRCIEQVTTGETPTIHHHWVPLDEMSIYMPVAAIAGEDQSFMEHNGFNFSSIKKALKKNKEKGKIVRGGSTISQQTAKNVFLWPDRSWLRKGLESYFTVLIELVWGKHRIMEVYVNSIEMGNGIYGADAVAKQHFNTDAAHLTRSQCALIVATLPNPRRFSSAYPSEYMLKRQRQLGREMKHIPVFPKEGNDK
jgi:monofunctional biosynthetic peptidoglycan transglycosylase